MDFGFGLATSGPLAAPESIAAIARRGEDLGFGFVGVSDHVVIPRTIRSRYPYTVSGEYGGGGEYLEQLTTLSFVAGHTSSVRLLTSVMVLPHRSPVVAAKMLATIDVLSRGRVIVGCGVGWMREEFEALGAPPYDERGAVGNEHIHAFKELWTADVPAFEGIQVRFSDVDFAPKPAQKPHPPIWVGGESPPALRRAAQLGDGWYPIGNNPRHPVGTPAQLAESISRLRRYAMEAGRDPTDIDIAYSGNWRDGREANTRPSGDRPVFSGGPRQVAADIRAFEELGVRHVKFGFEGRSLEETLGRMERFAAEVMPLV